MPPIAEVLDTARAALPDAPWVDGWLEDVGRLGSSVASAVDAARVLARLHASQRFSRVDLSADTLGDAHALDDGDPRSALVLRGLARRSNTPTPTNAPQRRALWHASGVSIDQVSTTCLVRALPVTSHDGALANRLDSGEPVHLTSRDLARAALRARSRTVFVCENPRLLEAVADAQLDVPVVCGNGNPVLVVSDVLRLLSAAGCELRYHGDFDWPGLGIATRMMQTQGARPWAMTGADYLSGQGSVALAGPALPTPWSPDLTLAMVNRGVAVHEEAVSSDILERLGTWERASAAYQCF